jgi:hypothetical protein
VDEKGAGVSPNAIWSTDSGWFSAGYGPFRRFTGGDKEWEKVYYSDPRPAAHLSLFGEDVALTEALDWLRNINYKSLEHKLDGVKGFYAEKLNRLAELSNKSLFEALTVQEERELYGLRKVLTTDDTTDY